ncbi:DUF6653 family protein [Pannonibacter carbonis]|uniref:DUF6653 family protein n=1 Tax=Pannonibacter carbonis TaxID=2067569 RepID=UPI0013009BDD|nr:DUF6653 family protein [Pannonibacter carbonis]
MASTANTPPPKAQPRPPRPAVMPARQIRWYAMAARMWRRPPGRLTLAIRLAVLPLVPVALWLHGLYGWPAALAAAAALGFAAARLPRLMPRRPAAAVPAGRTQPDSRLPWHVRALLGERMFLNRMIVPVPGTSTRRAALLLMATFAGAALALIAAISGSLEMMVAGLGTALVAQVAYLVLASRLYDRMQDADALYRAWRRPAFNDNIEGARKPGQAA